MTVSHKSHLMLILALVLVAGLLPETSSVTVQLPVPSDVPVLDSKKMVLQLEIYWKW